MGRSSLRADIESATQAISAAKSELLAIVRKLPSVPRAEKVTSGARVQAVLTKLSSAKTRLVTLNERLVELEKTEALERLQAARVEVDEAADDLDRVLGELKIVTGSKTTAVTESVEKAFTRLRMAKTVLADLQPVASVED